jgi:hypothetical protein
MYEPRVLESMEGKLVTELAEARERFLTSFMTFYDRFFAASVAKLA